MSDDKRVNQEFTGLRAKLWPIHTFELKKFLPMALMMMGILFNYSILRGTKDSLVVTSMGGEMIPFLKLFFVLPAAIIFMIAYSKLSNMFSKHTVFYSVAMFFIAYFIIFSVFLYPNRADLTPSIMQNVSADANLMRGFLNPIEEWVYSSFYVMAELWGSAMVSLMFWRFANDVTSLKESKRFYAMFGFVANAALMFSGAALKRIKDIPTISFIFVVVGMIIIGLYFWLNNYILKEPQFANAGEEKKTKKKVKMSVADSLKYIFTSKYLGFIALLVMCYGISINLVEVMWKTQAKLLYPTKEEFNAFMGSLQIGTGAATIFFMLVGANILRLCSWFTAAMLTPLMIFVTGLIFFGCIVFKDVFQPVAELFGTSVLSVIVCVGLVQNVLSKAVKYSLFDATKEMSYIPLDDELKSKGKAAVDVIGGRAGKSGGAMINVILLSVGSSLVELAPIISVIFVVIMLIWFFAVRGLNVEFLKLTKNA